MTGPVVVKFSELLALEFKVILKGLKGEYQFFKRVIFNIFHYNPITWHSFSTIWGFE